MSKILTITKTLNRQPIYTMGSPSPIEFAYGASETTIEFDDGSYLTTRGDMSSIDPDSPFMHMDCNTLDDYEMFLEAGHFIKDGYWYVGENTSQHVFSATPKEITIAERHNELRYAKKNRLDLITE